MELERLAINYFKDLFSTNEPFTPYNIAGHFPSLETSTLEDLNRDISDEEIFRMVKDIGAYKARGLDGYQAVFFHTQWNIIGSSFCKMIKAMCRNPQGRLKRLILPS